MDTMTAERRSWVMSRIRSRNTGPERAMRSLLLGLDAGFCHDDGGLPGRPDFSVDRARLAVFVDGCFFHGCSRHYRTPKSNAAFWEDKVRSNRRRDARVDRALNRMGWSVMRVWEHSLRKRARNGLAVRLGRRIATRLASRARNEPGFVLEVK